MQEAPEIWTKMGGMTPRPFKMTRTARNDENDKNDESDKSDEKDKKQRRERRFVALVVLVVFVADRRKLLFPLKYPFKFLR